MNPRLQERLTVRRDGEELEVFNWVTVQRRSIVRGHNPVVDNGRATIGAGDSLMHPEAVTTWVAEELEQNLDIDLSQYDDIKVVDIESDNVQVL